MKLIIKLDYIFTVDIFNEGIDIPSINQIIMLRPTQSAIIFVQQLGRGLRFCNDKEYLVVIDFIGNYSNNFLIPIALSGDKTYNKDTIRKYVMESNRVIPGCSTINFDEISKNKIFESLNKTNFSTLKFLKNEYKNLKKKVGHIPTLMDFYTTGSVDPSIILNYSKSYYTFLKKADKEFHSSLTQQEQTILEFVSSQFSSGKRPHELLTLKTLINNNTTTTEQLYAILQNEYKYSSKESLSHALSYLSGNFMSGSDAVKYGECRLIETSNKSISKSKLFSTALINLEFKQQLNDLLDYSLSVYKDLYNTHESNGLTLYRKYSRKDICWLLNWEKDESSTVYGYRTKYNTCPIFVTYKKSDDISTSTKYDDKFIDKKTFSWMTRNNCTLKTKEVEKIINYDAFESTNYLFVKKEDSEGKDFYYLGKVIPIKENCKETNIVDSRGKSLPIVNIKFILSHDLREDIFEYLTN